MLINMLLGALGPSSMRMSTSLRLSHGKAIGELYCAYIAADALILFIVVMEPSAELLFVFHKTVLTSRTTKGDTGDSSPRLLLDDDITAIGSRQPCALLHHKKRNIHTCGLFCCITGAVIAIFCCVAFPPKI